MSIQERRAYSHNIATSYFTNIERDTGILSKSVLIEEGLDGVGEAGVYTATINIPPDAIIHDIQARSTVIWGAGTTAVLDIGDSADPDGYFSQVDLTSSGELEVDEVINFNNLGGADGAYITAATGSFEQTFNNTAAGGYDVVSVVTTVGTASLVGRTYVTVVYSVPTVDVSTYVAT